MSNSQILGGGDCSPHGSYAPVHARRYLSIPCSTVSIMLFGGYTISGVYCYSSPVSSRVETVTNISELEVSVKTHWYTPASEAANVKERVLVRRPYSTALYFVLGHYSPVSSRVGTVANISELEVSEKTHWYTPASEAANVKDRVLVRRPLVPGILVGVRITGSPSFSHCTCCGAV